MSSARDLRPLVTGGTILGMGLGGFFDGILFHQILQLHSMLSGVRGRSTIVDLEIQMFWDGIFHAATWTMTALGLAFLWRAVKRRDVPPSTRALVGSLLMGWGLFNLVEGLLDHHVLELHHVVERLGLSVYDWAFLGSGVVFLLLGLALVRGAVRTSSRLSPQDQRLRDVITQP